MIDEKCLKCAKRRPDPLTKDWTCENNMQPKVGYICYRPMPLCSQTMPEVIPAKTAADDAVNHPKYYGGNIEVIDYIEDKQLDFCLGNAVKYISRAGKKDSSKMVEDLRKAVWYINREIMGLEGKL